MDATAPNGVSYATLSLEKTDKGVLYADVAEILPTIIVVGDVTQHFIDDYIVEEMEGVDREFHNATIGSTVMGKEDDTEWQNEGAYIYGTVLFDEDEQIFKMWYMPVAKGGRITNAYATSVDGENWVKSNLNLYNFNGSTANNIFAANDFPTVIKDYDEPDASKRYKMITFNELTYAHMIKYSADGIRWVDGPVFMKSGDVLTGAYDELNDMYMMLAKRGRYKRDFYTITSSDFSSFTTGVIANTLANPLDAVGFSRTDCYGAGLYPMYGSYVAFNWMEQIPGTSGSYGPVRIGFALSRDLEEDWARPYGSNIIIPTTDADGREWRSQYSASYAINVGDEVWLYLGNWEGYHEVPNDECAIQIAKWRKDGFASLNTGASEGSILTKPMIFSGNKLSVNANVKAGGSLKVELLDREGNVISGYSAADCDAITTNGTSVTVTWNGSNDLSSISGQTVRARFISTNTELYSFTFEGSEGASISGSRVELKDTYDYDLEMEADSLIAATSQSTLMEGDKLVMELEVVETATENSTAVVGIWGDDSVVMNIEDLSDVFVAGRMVKVEYVNAGDNSYIAVYAKEVGAESYGEAIITETGLKAKTFARLYMKATSAVTATVSEVKFYMNTTQISGILASEGVTFTELAKELEEVGPKKITANGYAVYGYNEGIDVGYGGTLTMSFDCLTYDNSMKAHIRLAVTDDDPRANAGNAGNYKNGYAGAIMGFATTTGAMDWYGDGSTSKTITDFLLPNYSYKLVYTATSSASAKDGSLILYECKTSKVGTVDQNWVAVFSCTGLGNTVGGNSFSPINDVKINIYMSGDGINMTLANVLVSSSATVQVYNQMYASATLTVEDSDLVPDAPDSELLPDEGGEGGSEPSPEEPAVTYTVTLDYNGATGYDSDTIEAVENKKLAEPDMTNVTLNGGTFVKWVDENGADYDFNKPVTGDFKLYAIWEGEGGAELPKTYISTSSGQFVGINENATITFGQSATWQFDVLEYQNAGAQIRLVASSATASSGKALAYKFADGEKSQVMGFAYTGAHDWYGGNVTTSKNLKNLFLAGYSYKLTYVAPSGAYVADASFTLYECETKDVGTEDANWVAVYSTSPFGNTEGGNHFAPYGTINLNVYFGSNGIRFGATNHKFTVEDVEQTASLFVTESLDWDYAPLPEVEDENAVKKYTSSGTGYIGVNKSVNVGLSGTITWQFDALAYSNSNVGIRMVVGSATAESGKGMAYKPTDGEKSQIMGFTATGGDDWYGGTITKTKAITDLFLADYSYKLTYVAPSGAYVADASFTLYECETNKVGTEDENWVAVYSTSPFGNTENGNCFAPYDSVNLNLYFGGAGVEFAFANSKLIVNGTETAHEIYVSSSMIASNL